MRIRCSELGNIMSDDPTTTITDNQLKELNGLLERVKLTEKQALRRDELVAKRDAKPELSKGAKSFLRAKARADKYGIINELENKYLDKGVYCEEEAIQILSTLRGWNLVFKNEERFYSDLLEGEPDVVLDKSYGFKEDGAELKCSWSFDTHPFDDEKPKSIYYWQCIGYMILKNADTWLLAHVLCNTPEHLFNEELERVRWNVKKNMGCIDLPSEVESDIYEELYTKHHFDQMPFDKRVKMFHIELTRDIRWKVNEKLELAREYYNKIIETI